MQGGGALTTGQVDIGTMLYQQAHQLHIAGVRRDQEGRVGRLVCRIGICSGPKKRLRDGDIVPADGLHEEGRAIVIAHVWRCPGFQ